MGILIECLRRYGQLLDEKDRLAAATKENNQNIEAAKMGITQMMIDEDCPKVSTGGYTFYLQAKTSYRKRSDEDLAAAGVDFLDVLREEGLGSIIQETVAAQTLQATVSAYVKEHGALSDGLDAVISTYEYSDIARRKDSARRKK